MKNFYEVPTQVKFIENDDIIDEPVGLAVSPIRIM